MPSPQFNGASNPTEELLREVGQEPPDLLRLQALIRAGADVNAQDDKGHTALSVAAQKKNKDAAAMLIDNKADMYKRDANGDTGAMFYALGFYDLAFVSMMLDKGYDPNKERYRGMTPLMWAANLKRLDISTELARRGADIEATNSGNGWTAMDYAENNNKHFIANKLREISAEKKQEAERQRLEAEAAAAQRRVDAERAKLDNIVQAGIPTLKTVKPLKRFVIKPVSEKTLVF